MAVISATDHEYRINGGAWQNCTGSIISVGNIAIPIGGVEVRAKATATRPAGLILTNATAFTVAATATQLTAPSNTQAVPGATGALNVTANSVANASSYKLLTSTTSGGTYSQIGGTLATPSYTHTGLGDSATRYYTWQAIGNGTTYTDSPQSAVFSGTTAAPAPTGAITLAANDAPIILLYGQSQARGIGLISEITGTAVGAQTPSVLREFQRVLMAGASTSPKLQLGVNNGGETTALFGMEAGLAQRFEALWPSHTVELAKVASSGQPISSFSKGSANYTSLLNQVNGAKARATAAGKTPRILGIVYVQGEADGGNNSYQANLQTLMDDLQADGLLDSQSIRAIFQVQKTSIVQAAQANYVTANANARLINTQAYRLNPDNLHYDARTQFLAGYTDAYNALFGLSTAYPFPMIPSPFETPVITSLSTSSAAVGTSLTIYTKFAGPNAQVFFPGVAQGQTPASTNYLAGLIVTVPTGATSGNITVSTLR